jgi:hypothetical protein
MKPIIEKRADAARIAGNSTGGKSSPISDATPDISRGSQAPSLGANHSISLVSERLTNSEIKSLQQDKREAFVYLQKVFPKARLAN